MEAKHCSVNRLVLEEAGTRTWEHDFSKAYERASMAPESFPKVIVGGARGIRAEPTGVV
jgi:hypothetical protein